MIRQASLLFLSMAAAVSAETPRWTRATPFGSQVVALTQTSSSPQTLYAVTSGNRIFASTNGGVTWRLGSPAAQGGEMILDAVADSFDAQTVYLQTNGPGILRSNDGGESWSRAGTDLPVVEALASDGAQPGVLWAATQRGLYRSADGGDTWQATAFGGYKLVALANDPRDPATFLAAAQGSDPYSPLIAILRSVDHGTTWESASMSPPIIGFSPGRPRFAFDSAHPGTAYVVFNGSYYEPVFRTTDSGANWTQIPLSSINDLASSPDGVLFAATDFGVSRSTDQGVTWEPPLPLTQESPAAPYDRLVRILASAAAPSPLLAAGSAGIWRSGDGGASWRDSSRGIVAQDALSLLASPVGPPTLLTAAGNSTYRSTDQGSTWTRVHTLAQGWQPAWLAALDPRRPRTVYGISTNGELDTVLKSTDGGRTWAPPSLPYYCEGGPPWEATIHALTLDLRHPETLYAAVFVSTHFQGTGSFVLRSEDGFQTSTLLPGSPPLTGLAVDPDRSGTLYGLSCEGFFKSVDAGVSWRRTGRNLPAGVCGTAIALDPRDSRKIWVGTAGKGVFFSADGGGTFQSMRRGLETARIGTLLFDPENPSRLYAGVAEKGVYQWNAASRRWSRLPNPGLPTAGYTGLLTLDPQHPAALFASHLEKGIFRLDLDDTAP